ncbi:MAG: DUF1634 domain-containing protein [bacterium]|nr:DUF1634 domain-containing protein [bacterium]
MEKNDAPKPPLAGIVYGDFAYWMTLIGMVIGSIGIGMSLAGVKSFSDPTALISHLLAGHDLHTIWEKSAGEVVHGHWYLSKLSYSDAIAMLGVAICCFAAVFGTWGSVVAMLRETKKQYLYLILAIIIAVILTLSAIGILSIKH